MNNYKEEYEKMHQKLKEKEWRGVMPTPAELKHLSWLLDRYYALQGLRQYSRQQAYRLRFPARDMGITREDFNGLQVILDYHAEALKKERPIYAYLRTVELLKMNARQATTAPLLNDHISYLVTFSSLMEQVDYIDNLSHLANFCSKAWNLSLAAYVKPMFRANLLIIEGKYGASWKNGDTWLSHQVFSNLVVNALLLSNQKDWRSIRMQHLPSTQSARSLQDWLEAFITAYKERMEEKFRVPTVGYVRSRIAFQQEAYPESAKYLIEIKEQPAGFYGLSRSRLSLMVYYELYYRNGNKVHPLARELETDPQVLIRRIRAKIRDLKNRQERLEAQQVNFLTFINAYAALLSLRKELDNLPENNLKRSKRIHEVRTKTLGELINFKHESGDWLRNRLQELS